MKRRQQKYFCNIIFLKYKHNITFLLQLKSALAWFCLLLEIIKITKIQKFGEELQIRSVKKLIYLKNGTHGYNKIQHFMRSLI